jgi:phage terminase large subunit-like protein
MAKATTRNRAASSSQADRTSAYAEDVVAGRIVAGPHVRNACRRHLLDLKEGGKRGLWFDREAAEWVFRYFESVLRLSEGQFEGLPFQLHPSQAFIVGSLFGWKRKDGRRRFRRAYVEQGKGNGKSPMAGGIGLYMMAADGEAGAQVYSAAAKRDQAGILFADAVKMVKQSPVLKKRMEFSGGEGREFNIAHHASGSFFRPVSRDTGKSGSGPRPYCVLADEVHEMPDLGILETLERGFKFRRNPLLFMITNSGSDRNSVAWEEHEHAVKVAAGNREAVLDPVFIGEPLDDTTFSYVCALDEGDDPLNDPSCWVKANPLLGVTMEAETLATIVAQAKALPGKLNGILRLHFCVWTDAEAAWMTRATLEPALAEFEPADHAGKRAWLGLDLSQSRDITALGVVVRTGEVEVEVEREGRKVRAMMPTFDAWIEAWTPGDTMQARELRDKQPYTTWAHEGHLHAPPGESISYLHVAQTVAEYTQQYDVQLLAYDRYAFRRFEESTADMGLSLTFAEHPQGGLKKGKPLTEGGEGLWMPGSVKLMEDALLQGRIRLRRNPVLVSAMMSAVTEEDKWGNHWLSKARSINKIDAAVALCMALGAASSGETGPTDIGIEVI